MMLIGARPSGWRRCLDALMRSSTCRAGSCAWQGIQHEKSVFIYQLANPSEEDRDHEAGNNG
jgi:hypothetical protein